MGMGRFGWNDDPAVDFCVEVDVIAGMVADVKAGLRDQERVKGRIFRAMQFQVGGDERAVMAKNALRKLESSIA